MKKILVPVFLFALTTFAAHQYEKLNNPVVTFSDVSVSGNSLSLKLQIINDSLFGYNITGGDFKVNLIGKEASNGIILPQRINSKQANFLTLMVLFKDTNPLDLLKYFLSNAVISYTIHLDILGIKKTVNNALTV